MKTSLISAALIGLLSICSLSYSYGKNNPSIYKNQIENIADNSTTISLYEGTNDLSLKPLKQYTIKYNADRIPIEKIEYAWNEKKKSWMVTGKYNYIYDATGKIEYISHAEWDEKTASWKNNMEYDIYMFDISKELLSINESN